MKRHHIITVIILSLLVPQLATALPRPDECDPNIGQEFCATQSESPQQICRGDEVCDFSLPGNSAVGTRSPFLTKDRMYTFKVSEIWYPKGASSPNHQLDAVCETTNGSTWNRTGRGGLIIGTTFYGKANPEEGEPALDCRNDHVYNIDIVGRGGDEIVRIFDDDGIYSENTGGLLLRVFSQSRVQYTARFTRKFDSAVPATPEIGRLDFSEEEIPEEHCSSWNTITGQPCSVSQTVTVRPIKVPPEPTYTPTITLIPELARVDIRSTSCPGGRSLTLGGHVMGSPFGPTPGVCSAAFNFVNNSTATVGGTIDRQTVTPTTINNSTTTATTCQVLSIVFAWTNQTGGENQNCVIVVMKAQPERPLPLLPPGSSANLVINWSADTTKLWKTPVNDENPQTGESEIGELWAPFHPSDRDWYVQETLARRLDARFGFNIRGPNGDTIVGVSENDLRIPGLGQIIEAMFTTKVLQN